jgi:hypothetical protein
LNAQPPKIPDTFVPSWSLAKLSNQFFDAIKLNDAWSVPQFGSMREIAEHKQRFLCQGSSELRFMWKRVDAFRQAAGSPGCWQEESLESVYAGLEILLKTSSEQILAVNCSNIAPDLAEELHSLSRIRQLLGLLACEWDISQSLPGNMLCQGIVPTCVQSLQETFQLVSVDGQVATKKIDYEPGCACCVCILLPPMMIVPSTHVLRIVARHSSSQQEVVLLEEFGNDESAISLEPLADVHSLTADGTISEDCLWGLARTYADAISVCTSINSLVGIEDSTFSIDKPQSFKCGDHVVGQQTHNLSSITGSAVDIDIRASIDGEIGMITHLSSPVGTPNNSREHYAGLPAVTIRWLHTGKTVEYPAAPSEPFYPFKLGKISCCERKPVQELSTTERAGANRMSTNGGSLFSAKVLFGPIHFNEIEISVRPISSGAFSGPANRGVGTLTCLVLPLVTPHDAARSSRFAELRTRYARQFCGDVSSAQSGDAPAAGQMVPVSRGGVDDAFTSIIEKTIKAKYELFWYFHCKLSHVIFVFVQVNFNF